MSTSNKPYRRSGTTASSSQDSPVFSSRRVKMAERSNKNKPTSPTRSNRKMRSPTRTSYKPSSNAPSSPLPLPTAAPVVDLEGLTIEQKELFEYYRNRIDSFETERRDFIGRIEILRGRVNERHKLKWQAASDAERIIDLQQALSNSHVGLMDERNRSLQLEAEIQRLKSHINNRLYYINPQELEDRQRIAHLLALVQPSSQEVTYFRDARPEIIHRNYTPFTHQSEGVITELVPPHTLPSSNRPSTSTDNQPNPPTSSSSLSASLPSTRTRRQAFGSRISNTLGPPTVVNPRILRTVYLPNETIMVLQDTIQRMQAQRTKEVEHMNNTINVYTLDRRDREKQHQAEIDLLRKQLTNMRNEIQHMREISDESTRDYMNLKATSTQKEREWREEKTQLSRIKYDLMRELKEYKNKEAQIRKNELKRIQTRSNQLKLHNLHTPQPIILSDKESLLSEELYNLITTHTATTEELNIIKSQYAAVQYLYEQRINEITNNYNKLQNKYNLLVERKKLQNEGYNTDVKNIRETIRKIQELLIKLKFKDLEEKENNYGYYNSSNIINMGEIGGTARNKFLVRQLVQVDADINKLQEELAVLANKIKLGIE